VKTPAALYVLRITFFSKRRLRMSLGSILVGIAIAVITVAYIAQPFRRPGSRADKMIESWVRSASAAPTLTRVERPASPVSAAEEVVVAVSAPVTAPAPVPPSPQPAVSHTEVNFCPQCGRRVTLEYRFCPGCGARLPIEENAA
jgi:hypothetical protein